MNFLTKSTWSVAAATAVLTSAVMATPQAAEAFIIRTSTTLENYSGFPSSTPYPNSNFGLARPTVINFNSSSGAVPTAAPGAAGNTSPLASSSSNGDAYIQRTSGTGTNAIFDNDELRVGRNPTGSNRDNPQGTVEFSFFRNGSTSTVANIGYFAFLWVSPNATDQITFTTTGATQTFNIASLNDLLPSNQDISVGTDTFIEFFVTNPNEIIRRVAFADTSSGTSATRFEIDNVTYQAIPTPAMLPGLIAMGLGALRKRKGESEAEA